MKVTSWAVLKSQPDVTFVRLPGDLQRVIEGGCQCPYCKAHPTVPPTWDTLAVPKCGYTYVVHMPDPRQ